MLTNDAKGFVYVLRSDRSQYVKIGRTTRSPQHRLREVNSQPGYVGAAPWTIVDWRQVDDCIAVEAAIHHLHARDRAVDCSPASELFSLAPEVARTSLVAVCEGHLIGSEPIGRLRLNPALQNWLRLLGRESGLDGFLDLQGLWSLSLFPSTAGGRYFTLNLDRHEVAYSAPIRGAGTDDHMLHVDELVWRDRTFRRWLRAHDGLALRGQYRSALPGSLTLHWTAPLESAGDVFDFSVVRRALLAYWMDRLLAMKQTATGSLHGKHHAYNAVSELFSTT